MSDYRSGERSKTSGGIVILKNSAAAGFFCLVRVRFYCMDSRYDPGKIEDRIYRLWEESGFFNPDNLPKLADGRERDKPHCIIMPPPNANEALHLGHALMATLEDILIRYRRLRGDLTLWLPGSDHAGFETQAVFEKKLEKQGKNRFQFDRETLYGMIWDYVQENKDVARDQLKRLGASCDWSRDKFTLDSDIVRIVYQTFEKLHREGLIYRGPRIINWCPKHQTGLSDLEVKYEDRDDKLWHIKYPLVGDLDEFIAVATTRPETMLGDSAVAVNPRDGRYQKIIGRKVIVPLMNREISVVADEAVEMEFGTGAVKVTPAHDAVDFEIGRRHNLAIIAVIGQDDKMTVAAGQNYAGLKTAEARDRVLDDLRAGGFLLKEEPHKHAVALCYKCGRVIEPLVSEQWFVKIKPLAEQAVQAVADGKVKFISAKYEKIFQHWMANIRDWNISRQIVWGIRLPVWYCNREKSCWVVSGDKPEKCPRCGAEEFIAETDTFDTWFSSGQWPFAVLQTARLGDFEKFYPTAVMETGWDILFFWVARMVMMGYYVTGRVPFQQVYLHGLIRDKDKQKMSKSKDNAVNPLAVVDENGADALRMALVFGASSDSDLPFSEDKVVAQKRFANKIWNAARFCLTSLKEFEPLEGAIKLTAADKDVLRELDETARKITKDLDNFNFHEAAQSAYHFFWHSFCDRCLEDVKKRLKESANEEDRSAAQYVLWKILTDSLKLLHPFMPFITEEIYQSLPVKNKPMLMVEDWPA